jgi:hypothetical protein
MMRLIYLVQNKCPFEVAVESSNEYKFRMRIICPVQDKCPVEIDF